MASSPWIIFLPGSTLIRICSAAWTRDSSTCWRIFLKGQQPAILMIIEEKLARFSDEKLVQFVEERIADDLQMIRINGSLVGAFVGMILYVVTFMAERMWS